MGLVCGCGEGYASEFDKRCRFCREDQFSRTDAKAAGVRYRGEGLPLYNFNKLRKPVRDRYIKNNS